MNGDIKEILKTCEAIKFGDFILASGKKSKYYIDVKKAITKPRILKMISNNIIEYMKANNIRPDYISCIELGAVPIGTAVSLETELPLIIIRKAGKNHGIKNRIIGDPEKKKVALLVEDVTTTGGSVISAVKVMRNEGLIVENVISIVDRDEGAEENLNKEGLTLISLVKVRTLLQDYEITDVLKH